MKQRLCKILGIPARSGEEQILAAVSGLREQFEEDTEKLQAAAARHKLPGGMDCVESVVTRLDALESENLNLLKKHPRRFRWEEHF